MAKYTLEDIKSYREMGIINEETAENLIKAIKICEEHTKNEDVSFYKDTHIESYRNPLFSFVISEGHGYIGSSNSRLCGFCIHILGNNKLSRYLLRNKKICVLDVYKSSPGSYDEAEDSNLYMRQSNFFEVTIDVDNCYQKDGEHPRDVMYAVHYFTDDDDTFDDEYDFGECDFDGKPFVEKVDIDMLVEMTKGLETRELSEIAYIYANPNFSGNVIGYLNFETQKIYINVIKNASYNLFKTINFASIYESGNATKYFELLELFDTLLEDVQGNIKALVSILDQLIDLEPYTAIDRWNMLFPKYSDNIADVFPAEEEMYNVTDLVASKLFRHDNMIEAEKAFFVPSYESMIEKVFSHSRSAKTYLVWVVDHQLKCGNIANAEKVWNALTKNNQYMTEDKKVHILGALLNHLQHKERYLKWDLSLPDKICPESVELVRKWINEIKDPIHVAKLTVELMRIC